MSQVNNKNKNKHINPDDMTETTLQIYAFRVRLKSILKVNLTSHKAEGKFRFGRAKQFKSKVLDRDEYLPNKSQIKITRQRRNKS